MFAKAMKGMDRYFSKHTWQNSFIHLIAGVGIGLLVFSYLKDSANMLGWALLTIGIAGHFVAFLGNKRK